MAAEAGDSNAILALLIYAAGALVAVAGMLGLSYALGQRHGGKETGEPYESGAIGIGPAHARISIHYYWVAMLFVIFDLEAAFVTALAVSLREVRWTGYLGLVVFLAIFLAILAYAWRLGAFNIALRGKDVLKKMRDLERTGEGR